jgi:hypothetical protein
MNFNWNYTFLWIGIKLASLQNIFSIDSLICSFALKLSNFFFLDPIFKFLDFYFLRTRSESWWKKMNFNWMDHSKILEFNGFLWVFANLWFEMVGRIWIMNSEIFVQFRWYFDSNFLILISFFQSMASLRGWIISLLCLGNLKWTVNKIQRDFPLENSWVCKR